MISATSEPSWWAASLNRRSTVEQWMFDAARGKRPMPTPEELHAWAIKLGTPEAGEPAGVAGTQKPSYEQKAIEGVAAWLLHRFGPNTPESHEAELLNAVAKRLSAGVGGTPK